MISVFARALSRTSRGEKTSSCKTPSPGSAVQTAVTSLPLFTAFRASSGLPVPVSVGAETASDPKTVSDSESAFKPEAGYGAGTASNPEAFFEACSATVSETGFGVDSASAPKSFFGARAPTISAAGTGSGSASAPGPGFVTGSAAFSEPGFGARSMAEKTVSGSPVVIQSPGRRGCSVCRVCGLSCPCP